MTPTTLEKIQAELAEMAAKVESLTPGDAVHQAVNDLLDRYQPLINRDTANRTVLADIKTRLDIATKEGDDIMEEVRALNDEIRASLPVLAAAIVAAPGDSADNA